MKKFSQLREKIDSDPVRKARAEAYKARLLHALTLSEVRQARKLTQVQLAKSLDATQSGISRIEHQTDLYLSTLRSYIEAMGGQLEVAAVFPEERVIIAAFAGVDEAEDDLLKGETVDAAERRQAVG